MKKCLFASAAAAAVLVSAPAFAGSGFVDFSYNDIHSGDLKAWALGGAAVAEVGSSWNLQGNAQMNRLDAGGGSLNTSSGGLHAFQRTSDYALGGYFAASDFEGMGSYGLGLEGAKYFDRVTLSGNVGYNWLEAFGTSENGWGAGANAKFFATDNFSFDAGVNYVDIDSSSVTTWSLGAEFKPDTMPVSFFAAFRNHNPEGSFFFGGDDYNVWSLGVRWNIGSDTLKSRDRTGASMKGGDALGSSLF